jgi:hypothetical protein
MEWDGDKHWGYWHSQSEGNFLPAVLLYGNQAIGGIQCICLPAIFPHFSPIIPNSGNFFIKNLMSVI